jgi:glycosyltransferase involved in cell wall biosynthesis
VTSLAVWSPLPPAASGVADYVAEQLPLLGRHFDLRAVAKDPAAVDPGLRAAVAVVGPDEARADLHLYHLGNSPAHDFVHRAARAVPGVAFLHEWSLHHLVLHETRQSGDPAAYLREMRRAYGERGTFVGRQVARGLGGDLLPALLPLNERVLESSLAAVTLTSALRDQVAARMPGRPVLALPLHFASPLPPGLGRAGARRALGIPDQAFVICAPGLGTAAKRLDLALLAAARLDRERPGVCLVMAGEVDPALGLADRARALAFGGLRVTGRLSLEDFVRQLVACDVALALRFPDHGEMSAALVRALGVGRPALVTAGTAAARELPDGVVVKVTPGAGEEEELTAFLRRLRDDTVLRESLGEMARVYVEENHDRGRSVDRLAAFLAEVAAGREGLRRLLDPVDPAPDSLPAYLKEELRWAARDLGLSPRSLGLDSLVEDLCPSPGQGL